jgi:hypothetical protein
LKTQPPIVVVQELFQMMPIPHVPYLILTEDELNIVSENKIYYFYFSDVLK